MSTKRKDEFHYILDNTKHEIRASKELDAAADKTTSTVFEICSAQNIPPADYKTAREKCVEGTMRELGSEPMFNDIMDVVASSLMSQFGSKVRFVDPEVKKGGERDLVGAGGYFQSSTLSTSSGGKTERTLVGNIVIFVGSNSYWIKGTTIHELGHFAMYTVFDNDSNPYAHGSSDKLTFNEVLEQTMRNLYIHHLPGKPVPSSVKDIAKAIDPIVDSSLSTFSHMFSFYGANSYDLEFVVRLPEILAKVKLSQALKWCFEPLALYWKDVITPAMRKYVDEHSKGHLLITDRTYEETALAHSGEDYLLMAGPKSQNDQILAEKAEKLIKAIVENDKLYITKEIEFATDDRLPRLALKQAIEHSRSEMFVEAFNKIEHKEHLGSIYIKALKAGQFDMANIILPHIGEQLDGMVQEFEDAIIVNNMTMFDEILKHMKDHPQHMASAFNISIAYNRQGMFDKMLPYMPDQQSGQLVPPDMLIHSEHMKYKFGNAVIGNNVAMFDEMLKRMKDHPKSMAHAFSIAAYNHQGMFDKMLPYMVVQPEYILETFRKAEAHGKLEVVDKMLPFMSSCPEYVKQELEKALLNNNIEIFDKMLPYIATHPEHIRDIFIRTLSDDKAEIFDKILPFMSSDHQSMSEAFRIVTSRRYKKIFDKMLLAMSSHPEDMQQAFEEAIFEHDIEMFNKIFPYIKNSPQTIIRTFCLAAEDINMAQHPDHKEKLDKMLDYISVHPEHMQEALNYAVNDDNRGAFRKILPYIQNNPQYMASAFASAVDSERYGFFMDMLPNMKNSPQYIVQAFDLTVTKGSTSMFDKMLPYMKDYPHYMTSAFSQAVTSNQPDMLNKILPYISEQDEYKELIQKSYNEAQSRGDTKIVEAIQPHVPAQITFVQSVYDGLQSLYNNLPGFTLPVAAATALFKSNENYDLGPGQNEPSVITALPDIAIQEQLGLDKIIGALYSTSE